MEAQARAQLREASGENQSLKKELTRLEDQNNQLQGYGLDDMSADELSGLIHSLTQVGSLAVNLLCIVLGIYNAVAPLPCSPQGTTAACCDPNKVLLHIKVVNQSSTVHFWCHYHSH